MAIDPGQQVATEGASRCPGQLRGPLGQQVPHDRDQSSQQWYKIPRSHNIRMLVWLKKDDKQCFDVTSLTVLFVLVEQRN